MTRFQDRVALVTGASRGIGHAIAERILSEGGSVVVTGRREHTLQEAFSRWDPARVLTLAGDAADPAHQVDAVGQARGMFGSIDVLVNNAGVNPSMDPLLDVDPAVARHIVEVNLFACLGWCRAVFADERTRGAVVNVSSYATVRPTPGIGMYAISKAAQNQLTAQLASELAPRVRVNAVVPALIATRFSRALYESDPEGLAATYPMGRLGTPSDVASATAFLASKDSTWITGQTLVIDGGLSLTGGS